MTFKQGKPGLNPFYKSTMSIMSHPQNIPQLFSAKSSIFIFIIFSTPRYRIPEEKIQKYLQKKSEIKSNEAMVTVSKIKYKNKSIVTLI